MTQILSRLNVSKLASCLDCPACRPTDLPAFPVVQATGRPWFHTRARPRPPPPHTRLFLQRLPAAVSSPFPAPVFFVTAAWVVLLPFLLSPPSVAARPLTVPNKALRVLPCLSHPVTCLLQLQRCPRCSWNLPRACGLETSALAIPSASVSPQLLSFLPHLSQVCSDLILLEAPPLHCV